MLKVYFGALQTFTNGLCKVVLISNYFLTTKTTSFRLKILFTLTRYMLKVYFGALQTFTNGLCKVVLISNYFDRVCCIMRLLNIEHGMSCVTKNRPFARKAHS